jgi:hypothetical protein
MSNNRILKKLILETVRQMNESKLTTDILKSCFSNVKSSLNTSDYGVPIDKFKDAIDNQIRSLKSMNRITDDEKMQLLDFVYELPDSGMFTPRDLHFAVEKLNSLVPDAKKAAPIDMKSLPLPNQVDVTKIISDLSIKYPQYFGSGPSNDPNVTSLVSSFNPADKKYFSHGMQIGSDNVFGEKKRIFPKDSSGAPLKRPDGSIIFFYVRPKTPISAVFDVYTNSFVSEDVFYKREEIYRSLWQTRSLPAPDSMTRSRQVKMSKI